MEAISKEELFKRKQEILDGVVFLYPTDTVYGLGCNAQNKEAVERIRKIKQRDNKPFSVIAPSLEWIHTHCVVPSYAVPWLKKLPGSYTLIFRLKDSSCVADSFTEDSTLGVRIPAHWSAQLAQEVGVALVSTSANISGKPPLAEIDMQNPVVTGVDIVVDEGKVVGKPSTLVILSEEKIRVIER